MSVDARMFRRIFGSSSKTPKPGRESAAREGDTVDRDAPPEPDTVEDHGLHSDEEDVAPPPSNTDAFAPELRALFNSNLLSDHRAHAGKLSALAQSLETHPAVRTHPATTLVNSANHIELTPFPRPFSPSRRISHQRSATPSLPPSTRRASHPPPGRRPRDSSRRSRRTRGTTTSRWAPCDDATRLSSTRSSTSRSTAKGTGPRAARVGRVRVVRGAGVTVRIPARVPGRFTCTCWSRRFVSSATTFAPGSCWRCTPTRATRRCARRFSSLTVPLHLRMPRRTGGTRVGWRRVRAGCSTR